MLIYVLLLLTFFSPPPAETNRLSRLGQLSHQDRQIPENFDARQKWPQCKLIGQITDLGECHHVWVFALAAVLTDRLCVEKKGADHFEYSVEDMLSCCTECNDRAGNICENTLGSSLSAIEYVFKKGVVSGGDFNSSLGCKPLSQWTILTGRVPNCQQNCTNSKYNVSYDENKKYIQGYKELVHQNGVEFSPWTKDEIKQVQIEIMLNGPVMVYLALSDIDVDFRILGKDDIYKETGRQHESHNYAVKLIGWGNEKSTPYWIIGFQKDWADKGFGKVLRNANILKMEEVMLAPFPSDFKSSCITTTLLDVSGRVIILVLNFIFNIQ